jgi:hypothetical protein
VKLDHINIRTNELEIVKEALIDLLLLEVGDRPPFPFPGYWLYGDGKAIVHLTGAEDDPGMDTGALDHVAFFDDDFDGLIARLENKDISYKLTTVPGTGMRQVFFNITHDVTVEVDFVPVD